MIRLSYSLVLYPESRCPVNFGNSGSSIHLQYPEYKNLCPELVFKDKYCMSRMVSIQSEFYQLQLNNNLNTKFLSVLFLPYLYGISSIPHKVEFFCLKILSKMLRNHQNNNISKKNWNA